MRTLTNIASMLALTLGLAVAGAAVAGESLYMKADFDRAQAANEHIVVEVFKKGCPTCAAQQPGLKAAFEKYPNAKLVKVDFKGDQEAVQRFGAVKQSTIIVFKGAAEVARVVGETDSAKIVETIGKGA